MPLVSVIIPTYNRRDRLPEAVASVLAQTRGDLELLVVDDGSTDGTSDMFPHADPRVRYLPCPHQGVSAARNSGIRRAAGRYLAFLDSDDRWLSVKLERQLTVFGNELQTRICYTDEHWIRNGVRVNPKRRHRKVSGDIFQRSLALCLVSVSSIMLQADIVETFGLFDESLPACEDYDLWLRMAARVPFRYLDEPLIVKYGGHPDQLSRRYPAMDRFRIRAIVKLLESGALNDARREMAVDALRKKTAVYAGGLKKRGKTADLEDLLRRLQPWVRL